jgi:hypothetical protein
MTFEELKNDLGSMINQVDDSGDFVSTFVTETEAERWLNFAYQDVYKWYATANRDRFTIPAYANTVEDQDVYTFGGDATDLLAIAWVGIKYDSTDDDYTRVEKLNKADAFDTGFEKWGQTNPKYFEVQLYNEVTTNYELGIEFPEECVPDASVTNGLKIMYVERPEEMSATTDLPQKLPEELHKYIPVGAAVRAFKKMGEFDKAEQLTGWFDRAVLALMTQEQSLSSERTKRIRVPKKTVSNFYRYDK